MKRLTWLVGPPGAGKSTWVKSSACSWKRVIELNDLLGPLVNPVDMRKGVLRAHGQLIQIIRELELHPENIHLPPLLVVVGLAPEDALFAGGEQEDVILLLPPRKRWERQLRERPVGEGASRQYDDYDYATQWYERFAKWQGLGRKVVPIETPYCPDLLGAVCV